MHNFLPLLLSFFLLLGNPYLLLNARAQVTGEGGDPTSTPEASTPIISITDSVQPSGATPLTYYSSLHAQATLPSSSEPTSAAAASSSNHKGKIILGVVLTIILLSIIAGITLFLIRRRMHKASLARERRTSWLAHWTPETKPKPSHQQDDGGMTPPIRDAEYPFALNLSKTARTSSMHSGV
jgi:hypothetical protein